jgi:thymidylate synthase (FAD)
MKVTYIEHMGSDLSVVNAARVSFGKQSELVCIDRQKGQYILKEKDVNLIRYLAKHQHKSPFNHAFATFHVKAPIFVARQLQKHEYMPWNEISRRYVDSEPEFYEPDVWRGRSEDKKQGSEGVVDVLEESYTSRQERAIAYYMRLVNVVGVCPEQARMVLPQSMYTEWYWSGSLYAFSKMCSLRLKEDTQLETREIAQQISSVMKDLYPFSWKALGETNVT